MKPKILLLDIETSPLVTYTWGIYEQNVGLNQVQKPSKIMAWSAKWLDEKEIFYKDQRKTKDLEKEEELLKPLLKLIDEADIVIGHNVKKFDLKRINAGLLKHNLGRPSNYRILDTLTIARRHFNILSFKLEFIAEFLECKNRKLTKRKYPGMELWSQCLAHNQDAWKEMEQYNKQDVIVLEEVYKKLRHWDDSINFSVFNAGVHKCSCGSTHLISKGTHSTNTGVFRRFKCKDCGRPVYSKENLLTKEQRKDLRSCKLK